MRCYGLSLGESCANYWVFDSPSTRFDRTTENIIDKLSAEKKPRNRKRCGAKNWLVAANQRSSVKSACEPGSDAFLCGALKGRRQEVRGQQLALVDEHLATLPGLVGFQHVVRRDFARHHDPVAA